ncbi:MAG: hypothetical protein ACYDAG_17130 [Chloroflexota bacterium]
MAIMVVLKGAENDKDAVQTAVRMGARERQPVRIIIAGECTMAMVERHLDFAFWDVRTRLGLAPPAVDVETSSLQRPRPETVLQVSEEACPRPVRSRR